MSPTTAAQRNHDAHFPEVLTERGVELPLPSQSTTTPEDRFAKGRTVQEQVVGVDAVATMYASAPADEQHIQHWL
jgi:4-carboxymuconolactone decarboxylase